MMIQKPRSCLAILLYSQALDPNPCSCQGKGWLSWWTNAEKWVRAGGQSVCPHITVISQPLFIQGEGLVLLWSHGVKTTQPKGVGPHAMESCWTRCAGPECTLATPPVPLWLKLAQRPWYRAVWASILAQWDPLCTADMTRWVLWKGAIWPQYGERIGQIKGNCRSPAWGCWGTWMGDNGDQECSGGSRDGDGWGD